MFLRVISLFIATSCFGALGIPDGTTSFTEGLRFYYRLNANAVYVDCWGTNNLTNVGTTTGTNNALMYGAPYFNGSSKCLTAPINFNDNISNKSYTVAFWMKTAVSNQAFAGTVGKNATSSPYTGDEWRFDYRNGADVYQTGKGASDVQYIVGTNLHLANEWTLVIGWNVYVAGVSTNIYLQVNTSRAKMTETGLYQTTTAGKVSGTASGFEIARQRGSSYLNGWVDCVALWHRELSAHERSMLWDAGYGGLERLLAGKENQL